MALHLLRKLIHHQHPAPCTSAPFLSLFQKSKSSLRRRPNPLCHPSRAAALSSVSLLLPSFPAAAALSSSSLLLSPLILLFSIAAVIWRSSPNSFDDSSSPPNRDRKEIFESFRTKPSPPLRRFPLSSVGFAKSKLFVAGLSWSVDEKTLVDVFLSFGDITEGLPFLYVKSSRSQLLNISNYIRAVKKMMFIHRSLSAIPVFCSRGYDKEQVGINE
ncbi:hypothetical protein Droror1_Dr00004358 [Drosera rotundifolia]